jgi:restriction endonuclease S subunit
VDTYEVRLEKIANIQVGYQSRGRIEEDLDGYYAIIRSQDFDDSGNLILSEAMRFSPKIDPQKYLIDAGDILVQARGQNHFAFLIEGEINNTVASNSFYIVRLKEHDKVLPAYLTWWLNRTTVQAYFQQVRGVSTIPFISKPDLQNTRIRIPPMETQKNISQLMQLWQREQKLNRQLLEKKEMIVQEVCRKACIT